MTIRPTDSNGDILPVLSSRALLTGPEAAARLVQYRLSLLTGEWWENTKAGFSILEALQASRLTEDSASALASMISAYIRETTGVQDVEDARFSVTGRRFRYSCRIRTAQGTTGVSYEFG